MQGLLKEHADMDATRAVAAVARRAQDLFRQQQQIEREVEQRYADMRSQAAPNIAQACMHQH